VELWSRPDRNLGRLFRPGRIVKTRHRGKVVVARKDYEEAFRRELWSHGVDDFVFEYGSQHSALVFEWRGRSVHFRFPGSGSDRRGIQNALTELRQVMRVRKVVKKSQKRDGKRRKVAMKAPPAVVSDGLVLTSLGNPFEVLSQLLSVTR
jgi:hypothetical protein